MSVGEVNAESGSFTYNENLTPGTYFVGVIADDTNRISESDEGNNVSDVIEITVPAPPPPSLGPDLTSRNLNLSTTTFTIGDQINAEWEIANIGDQVAPASRSGLYISPDVSILTSDTLLLTNSNPGNIQPPGGFSLTRTSIQARTLLA